MSTPRYQEVGRVAGLTQVQSGLMTSKPLRVGVRNGLVSVSIGTHSVLLDAGGCEDFSRLYFEAVRRAEAAGAPAAAGDAA
jgi:hypothetical protein